MHALAPVLTIRACSGWAASHARHSRVHGFAGQVENGRDARQHVFVHDLVRESLHVLESRLDPAEFVRVHRSHVVRIDRIRRLEPCGHGEYELTLADGTRLTSSRSYREQVRRLLR